MHPPNPIAPALTEPRDSSTTHDTTKYARMASQHTVQQMLAFTDDALIRFMTQNRDVRGMYDISSIVDWERTTETEQRKLRERLAALGPLAQANRPLDFSKLVEELNKVPPRREISSRESAIVPSSTQARRLASLSPQPQISTAHQIRCRQWLIDEGGKPLCSLETLDEIYENPEAHIELLQPWLEGAPASRLHDLGLFSRQLECWRDFRRWQRSNRGLSIMREEGFAAFLDEQRRDMESMGFSETTAQPDFETTIRRMWQHERVVREEQWRRRREVPDGTFPEYAKAARLRVARYGFTQQFDLREDAGEQDDRVTWIEYLEFECWTLDQLTIPVQPKESQLGDDGTTGPWEYERSKKRESSQQLRVQWVLSEMPADPEAAQSAAAARGKVTKVPRAAPKRKRPDENEVMDRATDEATDEVVKRPATRLKKRKLNTEAADHKGTSRMLLGLNTLVNETRVKNTRGGTRSSARIQKLEAKKTSRL